MYVLDYLVYHLRPYGIVAHSQPLPKKQSLADVVQTDDLSKTTEKSPQQPGQDGEATETKEKREVEDNLLLE